jgi:hypothetical protein
LSDNYYTICNIFSSRGRWAWFRDRLPWISKRKVASSHTKSGFRWKGLQRYHEAENAGSEYDEYAKVTTVLECSKLSLHYYVDQAGMSLYMS